MQMPRPRIQNNPRDVNRDFSLANYATARVNVSHYIYNYINTCMFNLSGHWHVSLELSDNAQRNYDTISCKYIFVMMWRNR